MRGGLFVVLDEAPMSKLLANAHVLLVGVQHVTGMWVLRGMQMKAYFSALKVEAASAHKFGGIANAMQDALQLAVASPVPVGKPKRRGATETTVQEWAREVELRLMSTGSLWTAAVDGTVGLGLRTAPVCYGGRLHGWLDFATASSEAATAKLAEVRRELLEVGAEIASTTPVQRNVPLSAQQPIRESGAAKLIAGASSDAS